MGKVCEHANIPWLLIVTKVQIGYNKSHVFSWQRIQSKQSLK